MRIISANPREDVGPVEWKETPATYIQAAVCSNTFLLATFPAARAAGRFV